MNPSTHQAPPARLRILMVLCALAVVSLLYLPLPVLPLLAQTHGVGAAGMVSSFGLAYALGFMLFGPLSDRLGRRAVMVAGLAALTAATALLALLQAAPLLVAGRMLQGLAAASFPPVAIAYLAERGTPGQRIWSVAWMSTAFLSAGLLGQVYGAAVAARWGLGAAMLPLCGVYALTGWQLWRTPADGATARGVPGMKGFWRSYRSVGALLADPGLRRVYVPAFLLLMCFVAFYMVLDLRLQPGLARHGISPLMARVLAAPAFLMPLAVAAAMPRLGAQRILGLGLACAALGLALAGLAGTAHVMALLAASFVFVAGIGISVPSLIARVASLSAAPVRGLAVALYTFVLFLGASLGPWLAQQTASLRLESAYLLLAALVACCALYAATGLHKPP